ncbi:MAG: aminotransferase class I/II-fold pyridoxal phosphate-dependent enzyme [Spirochaetaceae bacterium]|nr:aminotransferase class I/II-fold pyridoxal phosphate-dependent enzyme [Spirochaetaceae bacterium]MDT8297234.1 aminotransferase class I/II-fold pyridoxal phosphate-dependent enzyme [Spirochaetaceae bacterium]
MNPQAAELNAILETEGAAALKLLSEKGKRIFFPRKGLVAQGLDAKGKSINASIGEAKEDDGSPLRLSPLADRVKLPPADAFSYAPSFGKPALRDRWAAMIREKNPTLGQTPISRPVATNALTHGLSVAGYLFVDDGDEIILPRHYWGNYRLVFSEPYGAVMRTFETFDGEGPDAGFNVAAFSEALMSDGDKKIVLLNFPNNPTGYTPTVEEADAIIGVVEKAAQAGKTVLVITDDAYFGLVFREGIAVESPFARFASLHENVVACKVDGATKEDYVWGFRVGFITFAGIGLSGKAIAALEDKAAGRVRGSISNDSHLAQSLLLAAYDDPAYPGEKKRAFGLLKARHDAVDAELRNHPEYAERFVALPYNSGYFMCVKVAKGDAEAVRQRLLDAYDTGVIALDDLVRVAYSSLPEHQIPRLFANLYKACGDV